jgi:hypothetical protein
MKTSHVTGSKGAGRVAAALVVARGDDARAVLFHRDLRRAQHMAGRMPAHRDAVDGDSLAIGRLLRRAGEILAVADAHDVERLARRHHMRMAGPGMVGMAVRDQRPLHRTDGIDEEIAGRAIEALGRGAKQILETHGFNLVARRRE